MIHRPSTSIVSSYGRGRARRRPAVAFVSFAIFVSLSDALPTQEKPLPDFDTFTAEVKRRLKTDEALQSGYAFSERQVEQKRDGAGRVREEHVKVYEVYPPLPG